MAPLLQFGSLCFAALLAGGVNALAGGGTLLTFPALVEALVPTFKDSAEVMANGTSTVALAPASFSSAWAFRREIAIIRRWLALLIIPSLAGGLTGSLLVTQLKPEYFKWLVPWLILTAATLFALQPIIARWTRPQAADKPAEPTRRATIAMICFQFLIGVYGGYFGAGIGILMLSGLGIMGLTNIHEMNALKTVLAGSINGVAVIVFIVSGKVHWPMALAMMAAAILGGYLGASFGRRVKQQYVRWFVIAVGFGLAAYYFWKQFGPLAAELSGPPVL